MRILVVAATKEEINPLISELRITNYDFKETNEVVSTFSSSEIVNLKSEIVNQNTSILITGVGMVATAFGLGKHLATNKYDLAVNFGIAGSFDRNIALGDVCEITEDTLSELGAENDSEFLSIDKMGFGKKTFYPVPLPENHNSFNIAELTRATAITVNTVHGCYDSIKRITDRLNPQLESMEGAAFFYACNEFNLPCFQIRAVSNYVEKRNRSSWEIGLAIKNLNSFAVEFLKLYA